MNEIKIDSLQRTIHSSGRTTRLPHKAWQVFETLRAASPDLVRREKLIDTFWNGQRFTGEKGLNQALWQIRDALGEDAKASCYIETIPRTGYRWRKPQNQPLPRFSHVLTMTFVLGLFPYLGGLESLVAKSVSMVNETIVVTTEQGCKLIVKSGNEKRFRHPVISKKGDEIAFQVLDGELCELAVLNLNTRKRASFGKCLTSVASI